MLVHSRQVIEAHQYIYPSSTQQIASALGGMVDRSGNLWLDLTDGGVQQVPLNRWIICYDGAPTTILTRAEVQATYLPDDWDEAYNALGFQRWLRDPEPHRTMFGGVLGPKS